MNTRTRALQILAVGATLWATAATAPPRPRSYPLWRVEPPPPASRPNALERADRPTGRRRSHRKRGTYTYHLREQSPEAQMTLWVVRSGKTGFGVALRVEARREVRVHVASAKLSLSRGQVVLGQGAGPVTIAAGKETTLYISFAFDNQEAWNRGDRRGTLTVDIGLEAADGAGGRVSRWRAALVHDFLGARWMQNAPYRHRVRRPLAPVPGPHRGPGAVTQ